MGERQRPLGTSQGERVIGMQGKTERRDQGSRGDVPVLIEIMVNLQLLG